MAEAQNLLFERLYHNSPLFKNQVDLVNQLLHNSQSHYKIDPNDLAIHLRELNKMKAYVSQLLSTNTNRTITKRFVDSLSELISQRLNGTGYDPGPITAEVIDALKERNTGIVSNQVKFRKDEEIIPAIEKGRYISIITSRPLEIGRDLENEYSSFSFQKYFLEDLVRCLIGKSKQLKAYRFNFPLESFAKLFWQELRRFIRQYLYGNYSNPEVLFSLFTLFKLSPDVLEPLRAKETLAKDEIDSISDHFLRVLNDNKNILVFVIPLPIFSISTVAIDPSETQAAKLFALFQEEGEIIIKKFSREDFTLWRLFVWDQLKTVKDCKSFKFVHILEGKL
jgi:hypothetical protein